MKKRIKIPSIRFNNYFNDWEQRKFDKMLKAFPFRPYLSEPMEGGKHPIIQQGDLPIIGYSNNDPFKEYKNVVLFGDHTVSLYKPNKPFLVATDGVKILSVEEFSNDFLYTLLERYKPESQGYKRHFTILKNEDFSYSTNFEERNKIGSFFSEIDNLITLHQRKLKYLELKKNTFLYKMFPKKDFKVPEFRFDSFSGDWEQRKLNDLAKFTKGKGYSKNDILYKGTPIILYGRLYTDYETYIESVDTFVNPKGNDVISKGNELIVPSSGETSKDIARASVVAKEGIILGSDLNIINLNNRLN